MSDPDDGRTRYLLDNRILSKEHDDLVTHDKRGVIHPPGLTEKSSTIICADAFDRTPRHTPIRHCILFIEVNKKWAIV